MVSTYKSNYIHTSKTRGINQNVNSDGIVGDFYFLHQIFLKFSSTGILYNIQWPQLLLEKKISFAINEILKCTISNILVEKNTNSNRQKIYYLMAFLLTHNSCCLIPMCPNHLSAGIPGENIGTLGETYSL